MVDYEAPLPGSICGEAWCRGGVSGCGYILRLNGFGTDVSCT